MRLHNEIMNIQTTIGPDCGNPFDYKLGHRDARHKAAELSLKYERYIEELESLIEIYGHESSWQVNLDELKKECGL